MSAIGLTLTHARYDLVETARIPIALIGSLAFPALALLFFVVPNRSVADDPVFATQAVISLSVFAVMSNALFSLGITISENREKPWEPYLRTLPAPPATRLVAQLLSTGVMGLAAIIPVIVIGALATSADASGWRIIAGLVALGVSALPFLLAGVCIGYALPAKAAIAVVQVVMFSLAFIGGLFLPPLLFADWLNAISTFTPSRQAREFVIWATTGGDLPWWSWVGIILWTGALFLLALMLNRRDEGRRFR